MARPVPGSGRAVSWPFVPLGKALGELPCSLLLVLPVLAPKSPPPVPITGAASGPAHPNSRTRRPSKKKEDRPGRQAGLAKPSHAATLQFTQGHHSTSYK